MFNTGLLVENLVYARNGKSLETNHGTLDVSGIMTSGLNTSTRRYEWITCSDKDILRLPQENRATCASSYGNLLVTGRETGAMSFSWSTSTVTSNGDWGSTEPLNRLLG